MKIEIGKKSVIWNIIGIILSLGANLIILPFILVYLDDHSTALYYVFSSLSGIIGLLDLGFTPAVARSMAYAYSGAKGLKKEGAEIVEETSDGSNYQLMAYISKVCKIIYSILALIALILCVSGGSAYILYLTREYPKNDYIIAWLIYSVAIVLNLLFGYYSVFLRGVGAIDKVNIATIISRVVQIVSSIVLLVCGVGIIGVSIAYVLYGFLFRVIASRFFYKHKDIGKTLKKYRSNDKKQLKELFATMWPNTWRDGLVTVANYLLSQAITLIASFFLTLTQTGVFSLTAQLITAVVSIASGLNSAYQPSLQSAYSNNDVEKQKRELSTVFVFYFVVSLLGILVLATAGSPLIKLIKPSYEFDIGLVVFMGVAYIVLYYRNICCSYISCTNKLIYYKSFILSAVVCVVLSFVFSYFLKWGAYGLVLAQLLSQLYFNAWYWPIYVHKKLNMNFVSVIKDGSKGLISFFKRTKKQKVETGSVDIEEHTDENTNEESQVILNEDSNEECQVVINEESNEESKVELNEESNEESKVELNEESNEESKVVINEDSDEENQ